MKEINIAGKIFRPNRFDSLGYATTFDFLNTQEQIALASLLSNVWKMHKNKKPNDQEYDGYSKAISSTADSFGKEFQGNIHNGESTTSEPTLRTLIETLKTPRTIIKTSVSCILFTSKNYQKRN